MIAITLAGCAGLPGRSQIPVPAGTEIIAHRGASRSAPENTIAAALLAWEAGAHAVEADVRLTADGVPVVIHDSTALRTAGTDIMVSRTGFAELRELDPGAYRSPRFAGNRIPSLEELLAVVPEGRVLYVEVKTGPGSVGPIAAVISASGMRDRVRILSFDAEVLERMGTALPGVPRYLLAFSAAPGNYSAIVLRLAELGLDGLDVYHRRITPELVTMLHARGLACIAWTVDNPEDIRRLISMGVDGITTNRPERLIVR